MKRGVQSLMKLMVFGSGRRVASVSRNELWMSWRQSGINSSKTLRADDLMGIQLCTRML